MDKDDSDTQKASKLLERLLENKSTEEALFILRKQGFSFAMSRVALETVMKISTEKACEILCASETWKEAREHLDSLKEAFFDALKQDAESVITDDKGNTQIKIDLIRYRKAEK